jgi:hypothetical protein
MARLHFVIYQQWIIIKQELAHIASQQIIGTPQWYEGLVLAWLFGGTSIVQLVSCREVITRTQRKVIIKAAKKTATGSVQLSTAELTALRNYINAKKVIGTDVDVISQTADLLAISMDIQYTGVLATVEAACVLAIKNHLATLPFNDAFSYGLLINDVLAVSGVLDANITLVQCDKGLGYTAYSSMVITSDAGYWEVGKIGGVEQLFLNLYL